MELTAAGRLLFGGELARLALLVLRRGSSSGMLANYASAASQTEIPEG